jgi:L-ascorbate metabolism protein UlaG (beta-lactamase superfamily)
MRQKGMKVRYLGHSCFEITSKNGVKLITDPYTKVGYELPQGLSADVLTLSHAHFDHSFTQAVKSKVVLTEAKVYHLDGVEIVGVESYHDPKKGALRGKNVIYKITIDGVTFCHMGDIGEACSNELVEKIGKVDVLLIPVGGTYTVDAFGAKEYIDKICPKAVIPMHYKPQDGALDIMGIQPFLDWYKDEPIQKIVDGVMQIDENTSGIIYMERVK